MKFAIVALIAGVSAKSFPGFSALHAHCELKTTVSATCADTYTALDTTMNGWSASGDPSKGFYAPVQESSGTSVWFTRLTPAKKYTDDIIFDLIGTGSSCTVTSRSQSQALSYYDYDTNFCNMYNVYRKSGLTFSAVSPSSCQWVPTDADTTCNKY